jgi:hypothetical protein
MSAIGSVEKLSYFETDVAALLRAALLGCTESLSEGFALSKTYALFARHGAHAIFYHGARLCGVDESLPEMTDAFHGACRTLIALERQSAAAERIYSALRDGSLFFLPIKGARLGSLYPCPEMRRMGDVDILIDPREYSRVREVMLSLGFIEGDSTGYDLAWDGLGVHVELHKSLFSPKDSDLYSYFSDAWSRADRGQDGALHLSAADEYVFIFAHFTRHYRDAGIGIKHFADLWVWRLAHPEMDRDHVDRELDRLGLLRFHENVLSTLNAVFAFAPETDISRYIFRNILSSGEYGRRSARVLSSALREKNAEGSLARVKAKRFLSRVFPSRSELEEACPSSKKYPATLPAAWCAYLFRRVLEKGKVKRFVNDNVLVSNTEIDALRESLEYVGLGSAHKRSEADRDA